MTTNNKSRKSAKKTARINTMPPMFPTRGEAAGFRLAKLYGSMLDRAEQEIQQLMTKGTKLERWMVADIVGTKLEDFAKQWVEELAITESTMDEVETGFASMLES
ncbi:MAG TPA: hypothetical protein VHC69_13185 [Polyangiaceae bacterium]|nr:hypothetical protein [Polyangiaceae bacterium]